MPSYIRPVAFTGISSWDTHQRRNPKSTEPGTDYYCRIGTPVYAPAAGVVGMTGDSIVPATGRFVFIKFDAGTSGRALHLSRRVVNPGQRVRQGQLIGYSGATGYGEEDWSWNPATGGAHVHWTLWPTHTMRFGYDAQGRPYTLDFERIVSGAPAGAGEVVDMLADERAALFQIREWLNEILPGKAGVRNAGDVYTQVIVPTLANAQKAAAAAESLRTDFQHGVAGVQNAGRLYLLLGKAAADTPAPAVEVDVQALASQIASALPAPSGGVTEAQVQAAVAEALKNLTLKAQ